MGRKHVLFIVLGLFVLIVLTVTVMIGVNLMQSSTTTEELGWRWTESIPSGSASVEYIPLVQMYFRIPEEMRYCQIWTNWGWYRHRGNVQNNRENIYRYLIASARSGVPILFGMPAARSYECTYPFLEEVMWSLYIGSDYTDDLDRSWRTFVGES